MVITELEINKYLGRNETNSINNTMNQVKNKKIILWGK